MRHPNRITVACPPGTRERVENAAEGDGMAPADWLRHTLRLALNAARKRAERAGGRS